MIEVVLSKVDAERVFGQICGDEAEGSYCAMMPGCPCLPPSVKWLVVAEPLVCPNGDVDCPDCPGTGLPDVEIQSRCKDAQCGCGETGFIIHGVVPIGAAIRVVFNWNDWMNLPLVSIEQDDSIVFVENQIDSFCELVTDISHEIGSQVIEAGTWMHRIQPNLKEKKSAVCANSIHQKKMI